MFLVFNFVWNNMSTLPIIVVFSKFFKYIAITEFFYIIDSFIYIDFFTTRCSIFPFFR